MKSQLHTGTPWALKCSLLNKFMTRRRSVDRFADRAWNNGRSTDNVRSESSIVRANPWLTGHVVRSFGLSKKIQFWDNHDGNLFNLIMFPKKILTRGTFVCEIDDISCCQSRPQIGYCCACCKVLKIARPAAPKITRIASGANKSEKKKHPEWQYNELGHPLAPIKLHKCNIKIKGFEC